MGNTPRSRSKFNCKERGQVSPRGTKTDAGGFGEREDDAHVFLFPLAEVDLEGGHGELLAHPPLVVHRLRGQRRVLGAVPAHRHQEPHLTSSVTRETHPCSHVSYR